MADEMTPEEIAAADEIEADHPPLLILEEHESAARGLMGLVTSQPVAATCDTTYEAKRTSGTRPLSAITLIVMHSTEGSTARGAASWFANPKSKGSAHLCVDDNICFRTLKDTQIPWGAKGTNYSGFHIEQAGYAKWTSYIWSKTHRNTLNRAAFKTALHCKRYGIPVRWVAAGGLRLGVSGITSHNECSKAFGGTHWDPGSGWPRVLFLTLVRGYLLKIKVRKIA